MLFNSSESFDYHWVRSPQNVLYRSSSPVGSGAEASTEVALAGSIYLFNKSLNYAIWQGVLSLEPKILEIFKKQNPKGVLVIAQVFTDEFINPDVGVPKRIFHLAFIEGYGNDCESLVNQYEKRDKIYARKPGYKSDFYMFWAVKK